MSWLNLMTLLKLQNTMTLPNVRELLEDVDERQGFEKKMPPFSYEMHEMAYLALAPARAVSDAARTWLEHPGNPLSYTAAGRNLAPRRKFSSG
jgi:hypothetical protein